MAGVLGRLVLSLLLVRARCLTRWVETQRLNRSSEEPGYFGVSVGVSDSLIVVGGNGGAYKFHRVHDVWTQLSVSPGATTNVAIDGDVMLVGRTTGTTTVYVNEAAKQKLTGTVVAVRGDSALIATDYAVYALFYLDGAWTDRGTVIRTDSASVALSSMAVIGSGNAVRNYVRIGSRWLERAVLREDDAVDFGRAVSIDGFLIAVGAVDAVYVYDKENFSDGWKLISKMSSPNGDARYGASVAVSSDLVIVGALGSTYVLTADFNKGVKQVAKLLPSAAKDDETFGTDVYARGGVVVVGAPNHNSVYIFEGKEEDGNSKDGGRHSKMDHSKHFYQYFAGAAAVLLVAVGIVMCCSLRRRRRLRDHHQPSHQRQFATVHADTRVFGDEALPIADDVEMLAAKQTAPTCDTPVAQSPTTLFAGATFAVDVASHHSHSGIGEELVPEGPEDAVVVFLEDHRPAASSLSATHDDDDEEAQQQQDLQEER